MSQNPYRAVPFWVRRMREAQNRARLRSASPISTELINECAQRMEALSRIPTNGLTSTPAEQKPARA